MVLCIFWVGKGVNLFRIYLPEGQDILRGSGGPRGTPAGPSKDQDILGIWRNVGLEVCRARLSVVGTTLADTIREYLYGAVGWESDIGI